MLICRGCCRIKSIIVGGGSMAMSPIRVSRCKRFDPHHSRELSTGFPQGDGFEVGVAS